MSLSNLPPGVTNRMIDEAAGVYDNCSVCKSPVDNCICPACHACGEAGNPACYTGEHPQSLRLTKAQLISRSEAKMAELQERVQDERNYQIWLDMQPNTYSAAAPEILD